MKNIMITIIFSFCFFSSEAQIVKRTTYFGYSKKVHELFFVNVQTGQKHGKYIEYKEGYDGLACEGNFNEGVKVGKWIYYIPLGNQNIPYATENYNNKGVLHGDYDGKSQLIGGNRFVGRINNGLREGRWIQYFMSSPKVAEIISTYKNGVLHGEYKTFYESGFLRTKCKYVNGNIVDSAFGYLNTDKEPKLAGITIFDKSGNQLKFISIQNAVMDLADLKASLLAKYMLPVEPDFESYQQVKYREDSLVLEKYKSDFYDSKPSAYLQKVFLQDYRLPEKITKEQYDSLAKAIGEAYTDKDVPFTESDKSKAIICLYQLCKLNGKLSDKYKYELKWELKGNARIDYALKLKDGPEEAALTNFIEYDDMPEKEMSEFRFSCRFVTNWVMKKLIYYAAYDGKITDAEVDYINTISKTN